VSTIRPAAHRAAGGPCGNGNELKQQTGGKGAAKDSALRPKSGIVSHPLAPDVVKLLSVSNVSKDDPNRQELISARARLLQRCVKERERFVDLSSEVGNEVSRIRNRPNSVTA